MREREREKYEIWSQVDLLPFVETYSKWESRDSVKRYYWGDANQQSGYCACGLTGTCADPAKKCNCLIEDDTLREDSGYLTDSSLLPVTRVVIRMSSFSSDGYLTIGPMTCVDGNTQTRSNRLGAPYTLLNKLYIFRLLTNNKKK